MCGIGEFEGVGTHKDCVQSRIEHDESDVQKLVEVITSKAMANPFQFDKLQADDNDISPLTNIANRTRRSPKNVSNSLLGAKTIGRAKN